MFSGNLFKGGLGPWQLVLENWILIIGSWLLVIVVYLKFPLFTSLNYLCA